MAKRLSVNVNPDDERLLGPFRSSQTPERVALMDWAVSHGLDATRIGSEASLIRTLLRAGVEHLEQEVLNVGYATLAAELTGEERAETREARRRYIDRTDSGRPA